MSYTKLPNRILVSESSDIIRDIDNEFNQARETLMNKVNMFINCFNKLEVGEINEQLFRIVIKEGVDNYANKSFENLNKQLAKSGITAPTIIEQFNLNQSAKISELRFFYDDLIRYNTNISKISEYMPTLEDVSITNSQVSLIEKDLESLKDSRARLYIDSAVGLKLYEHGEKLAALFNEINDIIRSTGSYNFTDISDFIDIAGWDHQKDQHNQAEMVVNKEGIYRLTKSIEK